jgi:hypothetical protein
MVSDADHGGMTWLFVLLFILLIGPLAVLYGVDSRDLDKPRQR